MSTNTIRTRRNKLVQAKIISVMRRTGGNVQLVKIDGDILFPVELSEDVLTNALTGVFEAMIYDNHKRPEAEKLISNHYSDCMGIHKLTPDGVDFMNAIVKTIAEQQIIEKLACGEIK
ncbi:hypothetical protein PO461_11975 [Enterobacter asburiae]|uniref:hypothetical protein n=1 Tax=Enterobacter asburiae TaxID=61645 RepID=UPI002FFAD407